jgi:hypothetical protein
MEEMQLLDNSKELSLSIEQFIENINEYNKENNIDIKELQLEECPVHVFAFQKYGKQCFAVNSGTEICPLCNEPICPRCGNHRVEQISRVTGYMSSVSGWNAAKKQELKDRIRVKL